MTFRRDGFVSLDAAGDSGRLTTRPFVAPQGTLHLNVNAGDGEARAEVLDAEGQVLARSQAVTGDHRQIKIGDIADLNQRAGEPPIQLRFTLRNAKLFSYWFE